MERGVAGGLLAASLNASAVVSTLACRPAPRLFPALSLHTNTHNTYLNRRAAQTLSLFSPRHCVVRAVTVLCRLRLHQKGQVYARGR